jgi:hypothetical protein
MFLFIQDEFIQNQIKHIIYVLFLYVNIYKNFALRSWQIWMSKNLVPKKVAFEW